jgi:[ribosomal protein S5]-alanine N-acetyltransferase
METERLIIKKYERKNYDDFIKLFTDKIVMKFVGNGVLTKSEADKMWHKLFDEFYAKNLNTIYAVFAKEDLRFIGQCWIRPRPSIKSDWEIGYVLKKEDWRKGFATEISTKMIEFGFIELKLNAVFATIDIENTASIHVAEKSGMQKIRDEYDDDGLFYVYGVEAESFAKA